MVCMESSAQSFLEIFLAFLILKNLSMLFLKDEVSMFGLLKGPGRERETYKRFHFYLLLFFSCLVYEGDLEGKTYNFEKGSIDVIIPCCEKDQGTLEKSIEGIKLYVHGVRRIIIISDKRLTMSAEWVDEKKYPFSKKDIACALFKDEKKAINYLNSRGSRVGWIFQQMLKMYAHVAIEDLSPNCLIVDPDTIFLNKVKFQSEEGAGLFSIGTDYHAPYFEHAKRLLPDFKNVYYKYSGICHHMLLQKPIVDDLFAAVEKEHKMPFWKAFCACIDPKQIPFSSASEYEIYFNFALSQTDQVKIRPLKWKDVSTLKRVSRWKKDKYHYVTCHAYMAKSYQKRKRSKGL